MESRCWRKDGEPVTKADDPITITINKFHAGTTELPDKVTVQGNATEDDKPEKITGYFWTSGSRGRGYNAGTVEVEITNAADGYGNATISPSSVQRGAVNEEITIDFTAAGTMDGGAVRLVIPDDWGNLQDDDATEANYVEVDVVGGRGTATANVADRAVIANLTGVQRQCGQIQLRRRNRSESQRCRSPTHYSLLLRIPLNLRLKQMAMVMAALPMSKVCNERTAQKAADTEAKEKPLGAVYRTISRVDFLLR